MNDKLSALPVEFLFRMIGSAAVGERAQINGPLGGRYISTATGGGIIDGPRIRGELLQGFAWGPHRMRSTDYGHMHYDVRVLLRTHDAQHILMRYRGTNSPTYADGSWRTGIVFEAENGPYGWLNAIQAIGVGRKVGGDVEYLVYALTA
jgi:hypothetical protein